MSWFPVDDGFHTHPKAERAGDEAIGLWTRAGSYCMAYLTDGFVPEWWVKKQPKGMVKARKLVAVTLWRPARKDGEDGFQFKDWKPECTKAHVEAARKKARERKAKQRESQGQSRVTDGEPDAGVLGLTQPNPTQPINSLVALSGGGTEVDACEPRPACLKHPNENSDEDCRQCMKRRKWDEKYAQQVQAGELDAKRIERENRRRAIDACLMCDPNGMAPGPGGLKRCTHQEEAHA